MGRPINPEAILETPRWSTMPTFLIRLGFAASILLVPITAEAQIVAELDAYWAALSRTVAEGDFEGYGAAFHPDGVLVSMNSGTSQLNSTFMVGAEPEFAANREEGASASVEFRFTQRLHDEVTAHETGIFRYANTPSGGTGRVAFVHFDALLVKKNGKWLMLMEYQRQRTTQQEWDDLN
jgi:hypothetical protein